MAWACSMHWLINSKKGLYITTTRYERISICRAENRRDDNIKMDLREIQLVGLDWIHLAQHKDWSVALLKTLVKLRVP
jgi:predicted small integral membrane protein